jgi:predicted Zn-dependent peptidase
VRAEMLMGKENVMRRADILGHQLLAYGRYIPIEEILRKLDAVTKTDVQVIAKKLFMRRPIVTALGPIGKLEDYKDISLRLLQKRD